MHILMFLVLYLKNYYNLFNILYETSKNEPCYLYVFASFMSEESLEIKRNSTVNDILDFITEQELNFGTNFDPVFKHIVETMKYKHVIFQIMSSLLIRIHTISSTML